MKSVILNCTLKKSPEPSSTQALAKVLSNALLARDVESEILRVANFSILPGVSSDEGDGDEWPQLRQKILDAEIVVLASPTWLGRMSSAAQRVIERMDAFLTETDAEGRPVAYNHVAGCIATGNEDGAKHVIAEMEAALIELGFTIPGQSWTYYNNGSAMGPTYLANDNSEDKERTHRTAETAAANLSTVAQMLQRQPMQSPK